VTLTSDVNWDPAVLDETLDDDAKNPRLDPLGGETSTPITKSRHDFNESGIDSVDWETKEYHHMPVFNPSDLVGKVLVMYPKKDPTSGALIDRGANGGFAGADPRKTGRHVDDRGIGGLFTSCVKPSLPRSLPSITTRLKTSLPRSLSSITTRLAYFGITSKFGNCFALHYSSGAISLDLEDIKVTDEPRVWYLMAARPDGL
jgi:hypothetical protein